MTPILRPRSSKISPPNGYSIRRRYKSSALAPKKLIEKKEKSTPFQCPAAGNKRRRVRISNDDLLDAILPLLIRRQLFQLQFVNRRLNRLIENGTAVVATEARLLQTNILGIYLFIQSGDKIFQEKKQPLLKKDKKRYLSIKKAKKNFLLNLKIELRFFVSIEKFSTREKFTIFIF
jgi:hypothetical protein